MAQFSSGVSGGISYNVPAIKSLKAITNFTSNGISNPLDDHLPHLFNRIVGNQMLIVKNLTTGYVWIITLTGGICPNNTGYIIYTNGAANYYITFDTIIGCTVIQPNALVPIDARTNLFEIHTPAADGNKVYYLRYSPFTEVQPTITLAVGTLGAQSLLVQTNFIRYNTVL